MATDLIPTKELRSEFDIRIPGYISYKKTAPMADDAIARLQTPITMLRTNPIKPIVIVVQSVIGAGKSTLLSIMQSEWTAKYGEGRVVVIPEPIDIWNETGALVDFGKDVKNMCVEFQMFAFATRIKRVRDVYRSNPNASIYLIERDPNADKMFMEMLKADGYVSDERMLRYMLTWDVWMEFWPFEPTHTVHLGPGLAECQKRVKGRARPGEDIVNETYQAGLLAQHELYYKTCNTPLLRINDEGDYRVEGSELRRDILQRIEKFIAS